MTTQKFNVTGMTCAACQAHVEKAVNKVSGVEHCTVNLLTNSMEVEFDNTTPETIIAAVEKAGYGASLPNRPKGNGGTGVQEEAEGKAMLYRIAGSAVFLIILMYIAMAVVNYWYNNRTV